MSKWTYIVLIATLALAGCSYMPSWMGGASVEKPKLAGTRIPVLPVSAALQTDPTLGATAPVLPAVNANDNWPQQGGGFRADTANLASAGHFDAVTYTTFERGEAFESVMVPVPVVGGGFVYSMNQVGGVFAQSMIDVDDFKWKYEGLMDAAESANSGGGLAYDQGKLYVVSQRGKIAALDAATGKELWSKSLSLPFRNAPKVGNGKLFLITVDNQLYALNIADGSIAWTHRGINETAGLMNSVSPTVEGDVVIVPYSSGEIYVLSVADGKEIWSESLSAGKRSRASALFAGIGGDPVVDGAVVFSVSSGGTIVAQSLANGQHIWDRPIGTVNTPWLAGDTLFVLTTENTVVALMKYDGRVRWSTQLPTFADPDDKSDPITWKGPVMIEGKLAIIGSHGKLVWLGAADGKIVATQNIPEEIYMAPVVAGGRMFLLGQYAILYSLK